MHINRTSLTARQKSRAARAYDEAQHKKTEVPSAVCLPHHRGRRSACRKSVTAFKRTPDSDSACAFPSRRRRLRTQPRYDCPTTLGTVSAMRSGRLPVDNQGPRTGRTVWLTEVNGEATATSASYTCTQQQVRELCKIVAKTCTTSSMPDGRRPFGASSRVRGYAQIPRAALKRILCGPGRETVSFEALGVSLCCMNCAKSRLHGIAGGKHNPLALGQKDLGLTGLSAQSACDLHSARAGRFCATLLLQRHPQLEFRPVDLDHCDALMRVSGRMFKCTVD